MRSDRRPQRVLPRHVCTDRTGVEPLEGRCLLATLPVSAGLTLWLDASNVNGNGVNPANGAAVTSWKDLSGKGHHAAAAGAAPVFRTTGLNGKPSIDLTNKTDIGFSIPESADFSSPNSTVFIVYNPVGGTYFSAAFSLSKANTYNDEMLLGFGWGGQFPKSPLVFHHTSSSVYKYRSAATLSGTTAFIQAGVFGQAVDDTANVVNGTTSAAPLVASNTPSPYTTTNRAVYIGRRGFLDPNEYFNGQMAEIIVFNRKLTAAEQNQVGAYLKTKYAITASYTPVPEADVTGKAVAIVDGDTTAATTDDTDFGTTATGVTVSKTFTVRNIGSAALTTSALTVPTGFTVTEPLSVSIPAGGQDTFTVRLNAASAGTFAGNISFANNDATENPYNFAIKGVVTPATFSLVNGVVTVNGTTGNDTIRASIASNILTLKMNTLVQTYPNASSITRIVVNALAGNDLIVMAPSVNRPTSLLAGDGNDTIVGGTAANVIDGGAGTDLAIKRTGDTVTLVEEVLV
ncbi:MAG: choice-of-anchor D domain-containing protein [Tepidisphaeraceae bacterium]